MSKKNDNTALWVILGAGAVAGLWWLFKPKAVASGMTAVMPVPPTEPPAAFANLGAVSSRFDDLRDLYHMGRFTPEGAIAQVDGLKNAVYELRARGIGDPEGAQDLLGRLESFRNEIVDFIEFKRENPSA